MPAHAIKLVPTAVILVASASVAWPYFEYGGSTAPAPQSTKPGAEARPEITLALLHPTIAPRPLRDPFTDGDALQVEAKATLGKSMKQLLDEHRKRAKEQTAGKRLGSRALAKGTKTSGGVSGGTDPIAGLVLNGTVASGGRGIAMINGKSYVTGESVSPAGAASPLVLEEVKRDLIVLRHEGRTFTLTYVTRSKHEGGGNAGGAGPARVAPARKAGSARGKGAPAKKGAPKKM